MTSSTRRMMTFVAVGLLCALALGVIVWRMSAPSSPVVVAEQASTETAHSSSARATSSTQHTYTTTSTTPATALIAMLLMTRRRLRTRPVLIQAHELHGTDPRVVIQPNGVHRSVLSSAFFLFECHVGHMIHVSYSSLRLICVLL